MESGLKAKGAFGLLAMTGGLSKVRAEGTGGGGMPSPGKANINICALHVKTEM